MGSEIRNTGCVEKSTNGKGIIYYKLEPGFGNDITKGCGLVGTEIDGNFNFLRGNDIDTVSLNEENNSIELKRVNGDVISMLLPISSDEDISQFDITFAYNKETGILSVFKNGEEEQISGFTIDGIKSLYNDGTIIGDGTMPNPIRVNSAILTGTYSPANEYIDLTEGGELPKSSKGYRIVSKEVINLLGKLYDFNSVKTLNECLANKDSEWRVPSKSDFDELFNALECDEYKNHDSNEINKFFGNSAGQLLKSKNLWKEYNNPTSDDTKGLDTFGFTAYPSGNGGENTKTSDEFGEIASFWTVTPDNYRPTELAYVKVFHYDSNKVEQTLHPFGNYNSIRLIKDYDGYNYNDVENILGLQYPTVLIRIPDSNYAKIWTKINFYNEDEDLNFIDITGFENSVNELETVYYINEWDGNKWDKRALKEGDSIFISNKEGIENREWRIVNGIFQDSLSDELSSIETISNNISSLSDRLDDEIETISENLDALENKIDEHSETLNSSISAVTAFVEEKVSGLTDYINSKTIEETEYIDNKINELEGYVNEKVESLLSELQNIKEEQESLSDSIVSLEQTMKNYIDNEINRLLDSGIKNTVKDYIIGTDYEISINQDESSGKLKIGFSDDAIFG